MTISPSFPAFGIVKTQDTTPLKPWDKTLREMIYTPETLLCSGNMPFWIYRSKWCAWYFKTATYRAQPPHMAKVLVPGIWFILGILEGFTRHKAFPTIPAPIDDTLGLHWVAYHLGKRLLKRNTDIPTQWPTDQQLLAQVMEQRAQILKDRQTASTPTPENTMRQTPTAASLAQEEFDLPSGHHPSPPTPEQQNALDAYSGEARSKSADAEVYSGALFQFTPEQLASYLNLLLKWRVVNMDTYEGMAHLLCTFTSRNHDLVVHVSRSAAGVIKTQFKVTLINQPEQVALDIHLWFPV